MFAAEGVLKDFEQFSFSSVGNELSAAAEEALRGESLEACCCFAGKVTASNNEAANTLLENKMSSDFREYPHFSFPCTSLLFVLYVERC